MVNNGDLNLGRKRCPDREVSERVPTIKIFSPHLIQEHVLSEAYFVFQELKRQPSWFCVDTWPQ